MTTPEISFLDIHDQNIWFSFHYLVTVGWVIICVPLPFPSGQNCWHHPKLFSPISPGDWRSAGSSMGKAEVLVLWELRCSGRSSSHQSCRGLSCSWRFRWGACNPGRWGLSLGWSIYSGRGGLAGLRGPSIRVLLRDELEQGSCHGRADVLAGLGFWPSQQRSRWRWTGWRGWTLLTRWRHLVGHKLFPFWYRTIWKGHRENRTLGIRVTRGTFNIYINPQPYSSMLFEVTQSLYSYLHHKREGRVRAWVHRVYLILNAIKELN